MILSTGFSRMSERQYAIWDNREMSKPIIMKKLDDYAGVAYPFYDEDNKVLYVAGKGESAVSYFQYSTESPNYIDFLHAFKGKEPQKGFSFLPKRCVDVTMCEVMKAVRLTGSIIEYISFKVPRKSGTFQTDLFPPCRSAVPPMEFAEYWAGANKEANRQDLRPGEHVETVSQARKQTFLKKVGAGFAGNNAF